MCIAVPALVIETDMDRQSAMVTVAGNTMEVSLRLVSAKVGDYVLVHAGCAVEVLRKDSAEEILALFDEIAEASRDA